jgi:hypothetical protein
VLDLLEESQAAYNPEEHLEKRRRAEVDSPKRARMRNLDFYALVEAKGLSTPAQVMGYAIEHGTPAEKDFVSQNAKTLPDLLKNAKRWKEAPEVAKLETVNQWLFVCQEATKSCSSTCPWHAAKEAFFVRNTGVNRREVATACARVFALGPGKTSRVPVLLGPTNSGKSTLFSPVVPLFGKGRVFHVPPRTSQFPLTDLVDKAPLCIFLDDVRLLSLASQPAKSPVLPVDTQLKLLGGESFQVAQAQNSHSGHDDLCWTRGIFITGKLENFWQLPAGVDSEDVKHLKARLHQFDCTGTMPTEELRTVKACATCFCRWLVEDATWPKEIPRPVPVPVSDEEPAQDTLDDAETVQVDFF